MDEVHLGKDGKFGAQGGQEFLVEFDSEKLAGGADALGEFGGDDAGAGADF